MNKSAELEYLMNPVLYDKYKQLSCKEAVSYTHLTLPTNREV